VTVLLADDNWGNLMAVMPWGSNHSAGGGVYYHVDYVGDPRNYKWINSAPLAKMWEQMNVASVFNTTGIWILNVGDLKMNELPSEYFLSLAYDSDAWPLNTLEAFLAAWAGREFGGDAGEIADIMGRYQVGRADPWIRLTTVLVLAPQGRARRAGIVLLGQL
jgi:hypothetical protein